MSHWDKLPVELKDYILKISYHEQYRKVLEELKESLISLEVSSVNTSLCIYDRYTYQVDVEFNLPENEAEYVLYNYFHTIYDRIDFPGNNNLIGVLPQKNIISFQYYFYDDHSERFNQYQDILKSLFKDGYTLLKKELRCKYKNRRRSEEDFNC